MKIVDQPLVPREEFAEAYRKLKLWWGMRHIEEEAYILGVHLLAKMIRQDSKEISATWAEFQNEVVVRGDEVVAGPLHGVEFLFLGAVQQLHNTVGIFSHISQEGMERSLLEAREHNFISQHFTKSPGQEEDLLGPHTPMLFVLVPWAGYDPDKTWSTYADGGHVRKLPAWINKTKG